MEKRIKIKKKNGQILTITLDEIQEEGYISGTDKFGVFVKIKKSDIDDSKPIMEEK